MHEALLSEGVSSLRVGSFGVLKILIELCF